MNEQKPSKSQKRQPGATRGRAKVLKHGFYSRKFREVDLGDLEAVRASLDDEIAALRVAGRRIFELADQLGEQDPEAAINAFQMFGAQMTKIAYLLRTQVFLTGASGDATALINGAIDRMTEEILATRRRNS